MSDQTQMMKELSDQHIREQLVQDLTDAVIWRDSNLVVLNKPAGLASHGGPQTSMHVDGVLDQLKFGIQSVPVLAHRLDRDTAGCLLLCRHAKAAKRVGKLFDERLIGKSYWAVVKGDIADTHGMIEAPIAKENDTSGWKMVVSEQYGRPSKTGFRVLGRGQDENSDPVTWLELIPHTGRTHQLRVHLEYIGHPIIGDPFYGRGNLPPVFGAPPSLMLFSRHIRVPYHANREPVMVDADPPELMRASLACCGYDGAFAPKSLSIDAQYHL